MCKYCEQGIKLSWGAWTEVRIENDNLVTYAPEDNEIHVDKFKIEFCPMCNKRLVSK